MASAAGEVQSNVSHYQLEDFLLKMAKNVVETFPAVSGDAATAQLFVDPSQAAALMNGLH